MEKFIMTNLTKEEFQLLIIEAVKKVNEDCSKKVGITTDEFLSQREAAKFLRISLPTIIRWKNAKKIPFYQEGRKVLFNKSELLHVLQKNESLLR